MRELVAHGQGSGDNCARQFSNIEDSHQSSIGLFRTQESYYGQHGYSLRMDGQFLFACYPDEQRMRVSSYLNCAEDNSPGLIALGAQMPGADSL